MRVCVSVWVCVPVCEREVKKLNEPSVWTVFTVLSEPSTSRAKMQEECIFRKTCLGDLTLFLFPT